MADEQLQRKVLTVTLNGQTFDVPCGYTMRVLLAETEAGPRPAMDGLDEEQQLRAATAWQGRFLRVYFDVPVEFIKSCEVLEILNAATEVMKAAALDPFGRPRQNPQQGVTPSELPITGS